MTIEFKAERSKTKNNQCDCCFEVGYVTKITIPRTKYFDRKKLSTKYIILWICDDCLNILKLVTEAAQRGEE